MHPGRRSWDMGQGGETACALASSHHAEELKMRYRGEVCLIYDLSPSSSQVKTLVVFCLFWFLAT